MPGKGAKTVTVKEVLLSRKADVFLSYKSNAGNYPAESFRTLQIPTDENVDARYGMLLMTSRAAPLSRWLESQEALRLMAEAGFRAFPGNCIDSHAVGLKEVLRRENFCLRFRKEIFPRGA